MSLSLKLYLFVTLGCIQSYCSSSIHEYLRSHFKIIFLVIKHVRIKFKYSRTVYITGIVYYFKFLYNYIIYNYIYIIIFL